MKRERLAEPDLNNLTGHQLLKLFNDACSFESTQEDIDDAVEAGAPLNPDGSYNALLFIAWLVGERHGKV